jgi:predicted transcriptional regulator
MKNYKQKIPNNIKSKELKAAPVTRYMARDIITFSPDTEIIEVIDIFLEHGISGAPVLNDRKEIVGLIDDKDCINTLIDSVYHNQPVSKDSVGNYMTDVYKRIGVNADIVDVANVFMRTNFKRLLVVDDDGKLVGSISRQDVLRAIKEMDITTWH